jgi:hypothetical protein
MLKAETGPIEGQFSPFLLGDEPEETGVVGHYRGKVEMLKAESRKRAQEEGKSFRISGVALDRRARFSEEEYDATAFRVG